MALLESQGEVLVVNTARSAIAGEYRGSRQYVYNEMTWNGAKLYRCTNENGTTGNWNPDDWTETTVSDTILAIGGMSMETMEA